MEPDKDATTAIGTASSARHDGRAPPGVGNWLPMLGRGPNAQWLVEYPEMVMRHVETLAIQSPASAQRHLTIDVVFPLRGVGGSTWTLPVIRLAKDEPTSFMDLVDETGRTIGLPTRIECAAMTRQVLRAHFASLGEGPDERRGLDAALTTLIFQDPQYAQVGFGFIEQALQRRGEAVPDRLAETLRQLVDNSIVWLPLTASPGERKVVKLTYNIRLIAQVLPARKTIKRRMHLLWVLTAKQSAGRIDIRETLRRVRARFTARMGWDAFDLFVDHPVLQDPHTYHLQVAVPAGLQITQISPEPARGDGTPVQTSDSNRHLYVKSPRPRDIEKLRIKIRADRRGFMNASMGSAFVLAALLWIFVLNVSVVTSDVDVSPGAAVLLIAPALMVLFVSRPTESALVSATLTGIRTALGTGAICSLAAGAALAGARLTAHARPTLLVCAWVATASWAAIVPAWLGTFQIVRRHGNKARGFWCGAGETRRRWTLVAGTASSFALAAWGAVLFIDALGAARHPVIALGLLLAVPLAASFVWLPRREGTAPHGMVFVTVASVLAAAGIAFSLGLHGLDNPVPLPVKVVALSVGGLVATLAMIATVSSELAPMESSSSSAVERD
jgi:hypothetical protein